MGEIPILTTRRLRLRRPVIGDFEGYCALMASPRSRGKGGPYDLAATWGIFCHELACWELFGHGALMIDLIETGQCLGQVAINDGPLFPEKELGWFLYEGFEGSGFATEAAAALRDWAFSEAGVETLVSYCAHDNERSAAVARRLGARPDHDAPRKYPRDLVFRHDGPGRSHGRAVTRRDHPVPTLHTERLVLRVPVLADFEDYCLLLASPRSVEMGGPYDTRGAWRMFCHDIACWELFGHGALMIELRDNGECVGQVGINHGPLFPEKELGWLLYEGHEGRGYAFEAAMALRDWAFGERRLATLVSYCDPNNHRSIRVAVRLGGEPDATAPLQDPEDLVLRYRPTGVDRLE